MIFSRGMKSSRNLLRWASGILLCLAFILVVLGFTVFADRLRQVSFLVYWLTCFLLTGTAAVTSLLDIMFVRRKLRKEQRELIASVLAEAQAEQARKDS